MKHLRSNPPRTIPIACLLGAALLGPGANTSGAQNLPADILW